MKRAKGVRERTGPEGERGSKKNEGKLVGGKGPESSSVAFHPEWANGRGRFGEQAAGGHPKASPRPKQPLFGVPALRELESACRVSIL